MADRDFFNASFHSHLEEFHVFVVVARLGSFTAAAQQMQLTQPTVSQKIASLEKVAGTSLFHRMQRGVELTEAGRKLIVDCAEPFDELRRAYHELTKPTNQHSVRLATDFAFSTYWLLPNLSALQASIPELDLQIITALVPSTIDPANWDILIDYRASPAIGPESQMLFAEKTIAACSPSCFSTYGPFESLDALRHAPHISVEMGTGPEFCNWTRWYQSMKPGTTAPAPGITVGNFMLSCHAALSGHGLFLAQQEFVQPHLRNRDLVLAWPDAARDDRPYVIEHKTTPRTIDRDVFRWIADQCPGS